MQEQLSHNSSLVAGRSTWRYFIIGFTALLTLSSLALGLAVKSGPQVVAVRGELVATSNVSDSVGPDPAAAAAGRSIDEVLLSAVVAPPKEATSAGDVVSLDRLAPVSAVTPVPAAVVPATPAPTATPVATATPVPTATPVATATPVPTATPAPTATPVPATPVPALPTAVAFPPAPPASLPVVVPTLVPVAPTAVPVVPAAVPVVPTTVPTSVPVVQAVTSTRSGPAGVINQIPNSAWRWLDAHNWTVEWRQGPGPARVSEAQYATNTIVIWYDTARSDTFWAGAFGHELGHAVSWVHFSDVQTNEWNAQRGMSSWRWVPGMPNDFHVGEGDFAESFMSYLFGHPIRSAGGPLSQANRAWIAANTPF